MPIMGLSGGAGEPPPYAPTELYVTLSRHTALVAEPFSFYRPSASVQTTSDTLCGYAATIGMRGTDFPGYVCVCGQSIWPDAGQLVPSLDTATIGKNAHSTGPG
ncbi:hypothetical protein [Photorhabdus bodei]|uniref:Uncharacterized protein n=1 Tax=Photorhabdus bodei TaxID=2029681 RepID=A0AAW6BPN1_9GAMM|nr:hypothetical protein [Photorhabdus bodei]MDB6374556.1 hypothetical protein [Photorhabdus bodei]